MIDVPVHHQVLLSMFAVALALGAAMQATRFCTMGAVSDWVNMNHRGRLGAWLFAIALAIAGVLVLETTGIVTIPATQPEAFPPFRTAQFAWLRYLLGGLLFGVGMTLAGGCASRAVVRAGSGSLKSLTVMMVIALVAYALVWTDAYALAFDGWLAPTAIDLGRWGAAGQDLGALVDTLSGAGDPTLSRLIVGGVSLVLLAFMLWRMREFRTSAGNILGGAAVGTAVIAGWFITGGPWHEAWVEHAQFSEDPPIRVAVQSFTFISPMADGFNYFLRGMAGSRVSVGVATLAGVLMGSFIYALVSGRLRMERFVSVRDFVNHIVGAILLALGGVLAMGCSIGQGITGVSTLALGSVLALGAMIFGCAFSMKVTYYRLDGSGYLASWRAAAADFKLVPRPKPQ